MKIGVVGIGGIAQKAYLPVYSENRHQATFLFASSSCSKQTINFKMSMVQSRKY